MGSRSRIALCTVADAPRIGVRGYRTTPMMLPSERVNGSRTLTPSVDRGDEAVDLERLAA
jgi:hypothetical protein